MKLPVDRKIPPRSLGVSSILLRGRQEALKRWLGLSMRWRRVARLRRHMESFSLARSQFRRFPEVRWRLKGLGLGPARYTAGLIKARGGLRVRRPSKLIAFFANWSLTSRCCTNSFAFASGTLPISKT